jgi:phospholipid-binding lipoprotein MlaA
MNRALRMAVVLAAAGFAAGCASVPRDPAARAQFEANHDPLEPLNRKTFAFNEGLDRILIKPLAKGYLKVLPQGGRDAIRHFLDNLNEPIVFVNSVLQGRIHNAGTSVCRFVVNTTLGVAGFSDVASKNGLPRQLGDFGQTLWAWGLPDGPYLIIPLFGPSNPRDGIGTGVDMYIDPFRYVARKQDFGSPVTVGRIVLDGVDKRSRNIESLDEVKREAIDYYASFRSLFRQHRAAELRGTDNPAKLPSPDFYEDPGR